jgi:hypothetical protein
MTFKTQLASDLASVFFNTDEFAESVTYTRDGYFPETVKAIIDYGQGEEYQGSDSYGVNATMNVMVSEIETVTNKDTVVIGTDTWGVIGARKINDGLEWEIQINKVA